MSDKETALERLTSDLEKAQEMAVMGSWVLEVDTGVVTWTAGLHRIFGQDPSCPVPTLAEQESWYTKESWNAMIEAVERTSKDGSPYNMELEIRRRDGSIGTVRSIGAAECDEDGRIVRLRGIAQDISEMKETETQLKRALEQAKAAQVYKNQFLANMSHEIRTPLNGVVGFASLMRDEDLDAATRDEYISTIEACSKQLLNLVNDILDLAKIEAGEINLEKKTFYLSELIHKTAATLEKTRADKAKEHIQLVTSLPEGSENLQLHSDPLRIQQILTNLLSNALKFSDEGTIEFGFELKDASVEFFVKDEGIGIAAERADLIFERFEHLEGIDQKYEGTGLGLSISQGLAKLLGGSLTLESDLGHGSVFRLEIPASAYVAGEAKPAPPREVPADLEELSGTVLVAEDEPMNRRFIQRILKDAPFPVLYAENGKEAVRRYREHPEIELVLMDIRMPMMNGDVAAQEILKINRDAKIIAQTAYAMHEEEIKLRSIGFVDFLSKPYKPQDVLGVITKWARSC